MDMFLIAADATWANLWGYGHIVQVAVALGIVIFVHELGHFLAAKACGVKCEKFYVGFDVPMPKIGPVQIPSKIFHFQWGETEYGLGIIPLGGYVKMLGQDDNPANAQKEAERTRMQQAESGETPPAAQSGGADAASESEPPSESAQAAEQNKPSKSGHHASITDLDVEPQPLSENVDYELDPRSYTAKNVPQRMLIISAGVIMNVIFAVVFATIAYRVGVPYTPSIIGGTVPGSPAWKAELPLGYQILKVGTEGEPREHLRFDKDFQQQVILDGKKGDIRLLLRNTREGVESDQSDSKIQFSLTPQMRDAGWLLGKMPYIGVTPPATNRLDSGDPLIEGFPAADSTLQGGDKIVAGIFNGKRTEFADFWEMYAFLAQHADETITLHAERFEMREDGTKQTVTDRVTLEPTPLKRLGVVLSMGPVTAIQKDSIAEKAGIQLGDVLDSINGKSLDDPLTAPDIIRRHADEKVTLTVLRENEDGNPVPVELTLTPRPVTTYRSRPMPAEPMLVDALGLTYRVENTISALAAQGDARKSFKVGDKIVRAQVVPASQSREEKQKLAEARLPVEEFELKEGEAAWPYVAIHLTQWLPAGAKMRLTVKRGDQEHTADLTPYASKEYSFPSRGISLQLAQEVHEADNWGEATALGLRETKESLLLVFKFLQRVITGLVPVTGLGGPGMIFAAAEAEASVGTSRLLIFLTMLSANLAVVNFLPIPVLDGGHMMFLLYEGIFRRPVNETWQIRLSILGFAFLLCLMAFVISLDIMRFAGLG